MAYNHEPPTYTLDKLKSVDSIEILIGPEKKGLFLKHVEYVVKSKRFESEVNRRYSDFVAFHELLIARFPYRLIPKPPAKKNVQGFTEEESVFLENRRKGLQRWLSFIARHPVISNDALLHFFLTQNVPELHSKIKELFTSLPDEFATSDMASRANELVPPNNNNDFARSREQIENIYHGVKRIKLVLDQMAVRSETYSNDMKSLRSVLAEFASDDIASTRWHSTNNNWEKIRQSFSAVAEHVNTVSLTANYHTKREVENIFDQVYILLDILSGHQELCERIKRGVSHDHSNALNKMMALKKRQIQGVLRGTDAESVASLESQMLQQVSVISSVELRTSFSLYCVRMETALVHCYLEILALILNDLAKLQVNSHSELAEIWKIIQPTIEQSLP